jgi:very-short-patch-repair endonuclease
MASNGVVLHRVRLPRADRSAMAGLPPLTNRVTTVLDLLRTEDFRPARDIFDRSIQKRWLDTDVVTRGLRERPGRAGNAQLRRLVAGAEPGAQAESERLLHRILKQAGITEWVAQYRVPTAKGYAYLDVGFPGQLIAIEVDGRRYHDVHSDAFESDRVRQNDLQARGWRFLRFTWRMLNDDPAYVIAQIIALLAS